MNPELLLNQVEARAEWMRNPLRTLVQQESPSEDKASVSAAAAIVEDLARNLGARVKRHRQKNYGDVLELRFGPTRSSRKPILLLGHLDTVWPIGTLANMPWREEDGAPYAAAVSSGTT